MKSLSFAIATIVTMLVAADHTPVLHGIVHAIIVAISTLVK